MFKKIGPILGVIISLGVILGAIFTYMSNLDSRYAKAKEIHEYSQQLQSLSKRLDQKIMDDRAYSLQERIWRLEDRYGNINDMPEDIRNIYRELNRDLESIREKLKKLEE
jgi:predicted  nucleic acid-binding Zn-ribbon protein